MESQMNSNDDFDQLIKDHLRRTSVTNRSARHGLDLVKRRIALDRKSSIEKPLAERLMNWFGLSSPTMGFAMSVIAVQFVVISGLSFYHFSDVVATSELRSISSKNAIAEEANFLRIAFKATVTEAQMRELLNAVNVNIVAGPSQLGEYYLLASSAELDVTLRKLKQSSFVDSANVVKKLPPASP
jgi:hypothetical protein